MKDVTVAARYARALFLVTEKRGETAAAVSDLKGLRSVLAPDSRVGGFLASPGVRQSDKRALLKKGLESKVGRTVLVFIDLLVRKHRLNQYPTIVEEFEALVEKAQGIKRAHVVSAVPLTAAEVARLHKELERTTHGKINLTSEVDPDLLGGALVRIGDRVIDRSVRTLLDTIREQLADVSV